MDHLTWVTGKAKLAANLIMQLKFGCVVEAALTGDLGGCILKVLLYCKLLRKIGEGKPSASVESTSSHWRCAGHGKPK